MQGSKKVTKIEIAKIELGTDKIKYKKDPTKEGKAKTKHGTWYWKTFKTKKGHFYIVIENNRLGLKIVADRIEFYSKLVGNGFKSHIIIRAYNNL